VKTDSQDQFPNTEATIELRAGLLVADFQVRSGSLRNLRVGEHLAWRELAVLVRNDCWDTIAPSISDLSLHQDAESFELAFRCEHRQDDLHFEWNGRIRGDAPGRITYAFEGRACSEFRSNRIGFCLLHAAEKCAGKPTLQHRTDGSVISGSFPDLIEPQILGRFSMCRLQKFAHEISDTFWGEAEFAGEIFETEDQRNWTDSSFKTYGTPLELPHPVTLLRGEERAQQVTLSLIGPAGQSNGDAIRSQNFAPAKTTRPVILSRTGSCHRWQAPEFGLQLPSLRNPMPDEEQRGIQKLCDELQVAHLRYDLWVSPDPVLFDHTIQELLRAAELVRLANVGLELALRLPAGSGSTDHRWEHLFGQIRGHLSRVLLFQRGAAITDRHDAGAVVAASHAWGIPLGGGSDLHFCELNRALALGELTADDVDFFAWAITPQVHAFDDQSILETPLSLAAQIKTANVFSQGKPLFITPVTLKPRFNAKILELQTHNESPQSPSDFRQTQPFTAAWSMAVWHALATAGVQGITWFEPFGPRGIALLQASENQELSYSPVGQVMKDLASQRAVWVESLQTTSADVSAVLLNTPQGLTLCATNTSAVSQSILIELDTDTTDAQQTMRHEQTFTLALAPFQTLFELLHSSHHVK